MSEFEVVNLEDKAKDVRKAHKQEARNQQGGRRQRGGERQQRRGEIRRRQNVQVKRRPTRLDRRGRQRGQNQRGQGQSQDQRQVRLRRTGRTNQGQGLRIQPKNERNEPTQILALEPTPNVIIKGLGDFMTDQKLREICQGYGALDMCKLDRDSFGAVKPQGIGLVRFERVQDARQIVRDLNGAKIVEGQDENQSNAGQISVKYVESGENWQKYTVPSGLLQVRRRAPFKQQRGGRR